jgi:hypothetical protein
MLMIAAGATGRYTSKKIPLTTLLSCKWSGKLRDPEIRSYLIFINRAANQNRDDPSALALSFLFLWLIP